MSQRHQLGGWQHAADHPWQWIEYSNPSVRLHLEQAAHQHDAPGPDRRQMEKNHRKKTESEKRRARVKTIANQIFCDAMDGNGDIEPGAAMEAITSYNLERLEQLTEKTHYISLPSTSAEVTDKSEPIGKVDDKKQTLEFSANDGDSSASAANSAPVRAPIEKFITPNEATVSEPHHADAPI